MNTFALLTFTLSAYSSVVCILCYFFFKIRKMESPSEKENCDIVFLLCIILLSIVYGCIAYGDVNGTYVGASILLRSSDFTLCSMICCIMIFRITSLIKNTSTKMLRILSCIISTTELSIITPISLLKMDDNYQLIPAFNHMTWSILILIFASLNTAILSITLYKNRHTISKHFTFVCVLTLFFIWLRSGISIYSANYQHGLTACNQITIVSIGVLLFAISTVMIIDIYRSTIFLLQLDTTKQNFMIFKTAYNLSDREYEIAELMYINLKNTEIAKQLSISENTVKSHVKNIYKKVGVSCRFELRKHIDNTSHKYDY